MQRPLCGSASRQCSRVTAFVTLIGVAAVHWVLDPQSYLLGPRASQAAARRVAVVTVDNRNLTDVLETADYWTLSAVLNAGYAHARGYDFVYLQPLPLTAASITAAQRDAANVCEYPPWLLMGIGNDRPRSAEEEEALRKSPTGAKDVTQAVHLGRGAFRAASWAKLPALWTLGSALYDTVLFLDSDAIVMRDGPFEDELQRATPVYGTDARAASFVALCNKPYWRPEMPSAGVFLWRPRPPGLDLLRRWWDGCGSDRKHAFEQDALWDILDGAGARYEPRQAACPGGWPHLNRSTFVAVDTQQFSFFPERPHVWPNDSWVMHIGHGITEGLRVPEMRAQLKVRGVDAQAFAAAVASIRKQHLRRVDCLAAALEMHAASCVEARRCDPSMA